MMEYTVQGEFRTGKGEQPFSRTVNAESETHAEDLVLAQLTSEHGISRANVEVDSVAEDG